MIEEFFAPEYEGNALRNLMPSIAGRLLDTKTVLIDVPRARKYVLLMVDGLGWNILQRHASAAEHLTAARKQRLTCSVPSTTACSLTSLGCGVGPGRHGIVGYTFLDPARDVVINALSWENGPADVEGFRQEPTQFQRLRTQGFESAAVTLGRFAGSALTRTAFDGTRFVARPEDETDTLGTVEQVAKALQDHDVVYCYQRLLDHSGHSYGVGSWQWLEQLEAADDLAAGLATLASDDVCVLVTGDHGMVNVPEDHRIVAEDVPQLRGFRHIAGEGRFRQLYTDDPAGLAWAWRAELGDRAIVVLKEEAIEAGWFGPVVTASSAARMGDVLVAMRDNWAVMSRVFEQEFTLVGMHGSLTEDEMLVPLIETGGLR